MYICLYVLTEDYIKACGTTEPLSARSIEWLIMHEVSHKQHAHVQRTGRDDCIGVSFLRFQLFSTDFVIIINEDGCYY